MSSTGLTVYDGMSDPLAAIKHLGRSIAISGMFGCGSPEQGEVLALECMARKTPPLALAERYHFIKGKLSMKADAMLAEFHRLGGKVKQIERSPSAATVELSIGGQTNTYSLTWAEAAAEPFVYEGKESDVVKILANGKKAEIKAKYATPRARMQMLWARVVSDGVRAICPQVNQGRYTPEELDGESDDGDAIDAEYTVTPTASGSASSEPAKAAEQPVKATEGARNEPQAAGKGQGGQKPVETARTAEKPAESTVAAGEKTGDDAPCSADQAKMIGDLFVQVGVTPEDRAKVLAKRNASAVRNLTAGQAAELIANLQTKLAGIRKQSQTDEAPPFDANADAHSEPSDGPATPEQVEQAKGLLKELEQMEPGTLDKLQVKLNAAGYKKLAELPRIEAGRIIAALHAKNIKAYFAESLKPKAAASDAQKN